MLIPNLDAKILHNRTVFNTVVVLILGEFAIKIGHNCPALYISVRSWKCLVELFLDGEKFQVKLWRKLKHAIDEKYILFF